MATSREYKAVKNLLHNRLAISREMVKTLVKECIREMMMDALSREILTKKWQQEMEINLDRHLGMLRAAIAAQLVDKLELALKKETT